MIKVRLFKYIVFALITFLFLEGFFAFGRKVKQKWIVYITLHSVHWQARDLDIKKISPGRYKTIFLGNSLTELFDLDYYFKDSTILNCGIVGDFSEGLLVRAGSITRLKPEKLFIEIGINDMIEKISLDEICDNYKKLIEKIRQESPQTKIYIQSNLPVIINRPGLLTGDKYVNELIKEQNRNLQSLAKSTNCTFIDIYSVFEKVENKESLFIWDGIHFTPKGYKIWKGAILLYLNKNE